MTAKSSWTQSIPRRRRRAEVNSVIEVGQVAVRLAKLRSHRGSPCWQIGCVRDQEKRDARYSPPDVYFCSLDPRFCGIRSPRK
jgi:hypothetical protein